VDYEFLVNNIVQTISVEKKDGQFVVTDGEQEYIADIKSLSPGVLSILIKDTSHQLYYARDGEKLHIYLDGQHLVVQEPAADQESFEGGEAQSAEDMLKVKAPMPGKVIKINVEEQEEIRKNQTLAIVEAMKMENEIKSSIEGIVKKIYVTTGDLVDSNKPLMELDFKSDPN
jgi:biotin carboxyl carrier protein